MPKTNTHLHLAVKLSQFIDIGDMDSFLLGNAYPDCWSTSLEQSLINHYKSDRFSFCNLAAFRASEEMNDFNFGHYFHLWVDNRILEVDVGDISKDDCLICDMEIITPVIQRLKKHCVTGKAYQSMQNILALESEPLPLYSVSEDKRKRYHAILDRLADEFVEHLNSV